MKILLCFCILGLAVAACGSDGGVEPTSPAALPPAGPAEEGPAPEVETETPTPEEPTPEAPAPPVEALAPQVTGVAAATDTDPSPDVVEVSLVAQESSLELLAGTQTPMWTFNGQLPGPLIEATVGDRVIVHFVNQLSEPTTIHWHGMRVPNEMDGTPRTQDPVPPGGSFTYDFVVQDAGTFWYHPHIRSHVQVERGLYGVFVVHEAEPPAYDAERIVFLDDILLLDNGFRQAFLMSHPEQMHGRNGNVLLVNGKAVAGDELLQLRRGSVERWRLLNAANARTAIIDLAGAEWRVIGSDGGLLPAKVDAEYLQIAPGDRVDIEVRWNPTSPADLGELRWWVPAVVDGEVQLVPIVLQTIQSTGHPPLAPRQVELPTVTLPDWPVADTPTLELQLDGANVGGTIQWMINGQTFDTAAPIEVGLGEVHTIDLVNMTMQEHPFHLHGHFFQVVSRNGAPAPETGLEDTLFIGGQETVRVVVEFDNPGGWMAHCHILEHAALGMMTLIEVVE